MKSEALKYLESHLAIGHINIPEFSALHDLLALFNRLNKRVRRMYVGDMDWCTGTILIAEEAADARKHLHLFHCLYSHTARECQEAATERGALSPSNPSDAPWAWIRGSTFKDDMERLPGTKELFERISAHFDDNVYHPFLESHRRNPQHRIWELEPELTAIYVAMTELYSLVSTATESAYQIAQKLSDYQRACEERGEGQTLKQSNRRYSSDPKRSWLAGIRLSPPVAGSIIREEVPNHPYGNGKSFGAIEEAVNRRPVVAKAKHTVHTIEETPEVRPQPGSVARRIEHVVPRIFTGSFSELEESIRKLRVPKTDTSPTTKTAMRDPNMTAESATTPISCPTPSSVHSSPGLRRREALIERDVEFQDRVIHGDVIRSRRPVEGELTGAARIQVKEDAVFKDETLTRWLNEPPENGREALPSKLRKDTAV